MDDERKRQRRFLLFAVTYVVVTLLVNVATRRSRDEVLGSFAGAVVSVAMLAILVRNPRLMRSMQDNRYRVLAWLSGGLALLIVLAAVLSREAAILVVIPVPLIGLVVSFIAARRASGS